MSIATEGMLVALHLSMWDGFKFDREASRKVVNEAGAEEGTARVNKLIIPPDVLKEVKGARSAIYTHFTDNTLPWKDTGERLLMRKRYFDFIEKHEKLVGDFHAAVDHLVTVKYPSARDQAAFRMASMFKRDDYPHPEALRAKFAVALDIDAVTEAGDFRCTLQADQVSDIQAKMQEAMRERLNAAQSHVWDKLAKMVEHYQERMADSEGRLYESVKDNLFELLDILPGLNVMGDPELEKLGKEIKQKLQSFDIKTMRKDKDVKSQAASEATKIVAKMKAMMASLKNAAAEDDDDD
jgi:predicted secreted Zn-dependent protease